MEQIKAPWTEEQVLALLRYQLGRWMHPFTCGSGNRTDEAHLDGEGILIPTQKGWICPWCSYTQDWAHAFMFEGPPEFIVRTRRERQNSLEG